MRLAEESTNSFDWTGLFTSAIKTVPEITGQYYGSKMPTGGPVVIQAPPPTPAPVPYKVPTWVMLAIPATLIGGFFALKAARK